MLLVLLSCAGQKDSNEELALFEPNTISTDLYEFGGTFSPNGNLFFYTLSSPNYYIREYTIVFSRKVNGKWSEPEVAPFSGLFSDRDPYFSPDGNYIYFASMRPLANGQIKNDFDLWRVMIQDGTFTSDPEHLSVNTPMPEMTPAVDADGNLYFSSFVPGDNRGSLDIYFSPYQDGFYGNPENLGDSINSPGVDAYPYVTPDGKSLYFSSRMEGGFGDYDIYFSEQNADQVWVKSKNLGDEVNGEFWEIAPLVFDGILYLSSTRHEEGVTVRSKQEWDALQAGPMNGLSNIYSINRDQ